MYIDAVRLCTDTHRVLKENHAVKYVESMVCVMYLTIQIGKI
jgi:hypothetical protein